MVFYPHATPGRVQDTSCTPLEHVFSRLLPLRNDVLTRKHRLNKLPEHIWCKLQNIRYLKGHSKASKYLKLSKLVKSLNSLYSACIGSFIDRLNLI